MKLAFEEFGTGTPVVLLHAFPLSRTMWLSQIEDLKNEKFRVIIPDLRGFGESHNFADINSMEEMAKDIVELLDLLKIEPAIIGGLSMGGYVAFNLYRLFPEKFSALVLCDTTYTADTEEKRESRLDLIENIEKKGSQVLIEKMLPNVISDQTKQNNPVLVDELEKTFTEVNPQAAIAALRGMAGRADHSDILDKIVVPTALIFGIDDKITNLDAAETMNRKIKNSRLFRIENAGHYSNLEQPHQFNSALIEFLKEIS